MADISSNEIYDAVLFIKDRMVTKDEFTAEINRLEQKMDNGFAAVQGKIAGIHTRVDHETEKDYEQDVRIARLERAVEEK